MLEYLSSMDTVEDKDRIDRRRDTGGAGQMALWVVLSSLYNIANSFYTYLISTRLLTILLAYLFSYCTFAYVVSQVENSMIKLNMDDIPKLNSKIRYGKGKGKNRTARPTNKPRKGKTKPNNKSRKKYQKKRKKPEF